MRNEDSVCICTTFYTRSTESEETFLLYEYDEETRNTRGISLFKDEVRIWGVKDVKSYLSIKGVLKDRYMTVFIEYPALGEINLGRYFINKSKSGTFNIPDFDGISSMHMYVGGRPGLKSSLFNGVIASLDIFYNKKDLKLPKHLINLILDQHIIDINKCDT